MKEAIGGTMTIYIIIIFLLLINGYLAFSVNYTKAFRVKNEIISLIEQHEGYTEDAKEEIMAYLNKIKYVDIPRDYMNTVIRNNGDYTCEYGYCYKVTVVGEDNDTTNELYRGTYYSIITFVNIDIPVLNKVLPLFNVFQVKGETKMIYSSGTDSEFQT